MLQVAEMIPRVKMMAKMLLSEGRYTPLPMVMKNRTLRMCGLIKCYLLWNVFLDGYTGIQVFN